MNCKIEEPFIFNCWKHHNDFVCSQIGFFTGLGENGFPKLKHELKKIGESQTDFYFGKLSPTEIKEEIKNYLLVEKKFDIELFTAWLETNKLMYKMIELSDTSTWTLRLGLDEKRYIHFHPGRQSHNTIRIKASTLKTAIASIIWARIFNLSPEKISTVNDSRKILLELPPVKGFYINKSILKVISLLKDESS